MVKSTTKRVGITGHNAGLLFLFFFIPFLFFGFPCNRAEVNCLIELSRVSLSDLHCCRD